MIIIISIPLLLAELSRTRSALSGAPWIKFGKLFSRENLVMMQGTPTHTSCKPMSNATIDLPHLDTSLSVSYVTHP